MDVILLLQDTRVDSHLIEATFKQGQLSNCSTNICIIYLLTYLMNYLLNQLAMDSFLVT